MTVDSFGEEIQLHYLGFFYRKIHIKEGKMEEKKDVIYISSKEALIKIFVLVSVLGIRLLLISRFVTNQICFHVTNLLSFVSLAFLCNPADFLPDYTL